MTNPAAGRFGDRIERGPAASFRCARCGELAGVVRVVRAGATVNMGPPLGIETPDRDGLVLDHFLGTAWQAQSAEVLDAVQALIEAGNVDPAAIRGISLALRGGTPFYCPDCGLELLQRGLGHLRRVRRGLLRLHRGTCPNGHRHVPGD